MVHVFSQMFEVIFFLFFSYAGAEVVRSVLTHSKDLHRDAILSTLLAMAKNSYESPFASQVQPEEPDKRIVLDGCQQVKLYAFASVCRIHTLSDPSRSFINLLEHFRTGRP